LANRASLGRVESRVREVEFQVLANSVIRASFEVWSRTARASVLAGGHHALVDAQALRAAWIASRNR